MMKKADDNQTILPMKLTYSVEDNQTILPVKLTYNVEDNQTILPVKLTYSVEDNQTILPVNLTYRSLPSASDTRIFGIYYRYTSMRKRTAWPTGFLLFSR